MASTARIDPIVRGREIFFSLIKPGAGGSVFVPAGCMSKFDETLEKETISISCRSVVGKISSGKPAESKISLEGVYMIYATGDQAAQVSYTEMRSWINGASISCKFGTVNTGDANWTRLYVIKSLKLTADNEGVATYSIDLESATGDEVYNAVAA